jgi:hypothetical protein
MILGSCLPCPFHTIREDGEGSGSHCGKENCWSRFSKCLARKALDRFLAQEAAPPRPFSALSHVYIQE